MIDAVDGELRERFGELADPTDDSSWADVAQRASALSEPLRPRVVLAIAAALALVLVAAPALALRGKIVRLLGDGGHAPHRVQRSFASMDRDGGTPPVFRMGVEANRAIKLLGSGKATLWLAPTRDGGFCTSLGDCYRFPYVDDRLSLTVSLHGRIARDGQILSGPVLLHGITANQNADSLLLRFEDGETERIPLVWVAAPVDAGFFLYAVRQAHWRTGHLPTRLALLAADGKELDAREVHGITTRGSFPTSAK